MKELNFLDYLSTVKKIKRYNKYIEEDEDDQICERIPIKVSFFNVCMHPDICKHCSMTYVQHLAYHYAFQIDSLDAIH